MPGRKGQVTIETVGRVTSVQGSGQQKNGAVEGTWSATGVIEDSGSFTCAWTQTGEMFHCSTQLAGSHGTLTIERRARIEWTDGVGRFSSAMTWHIIDGTGSYEGITGGGGGLAKSHTLDSYIDSNVNHFDEIQFGTVRVPN